jgi:hypothetical protein
MPFSPAFSADIPLLNLRRLFVGLTPFGSLRPITLNPSYVFRYFNGDFCFDVPFFIHAHFLRSKNRAYNKSLVYMKLNFKSVLISVDYNSEGLTAFIIWP